MARPNRRTRARRAAANAQERLNDVVNGWGAGGVERELPGVQVAPALRARVIVGKVVTCPTGSGEVDPETGEAVHGSSYTTGEIAQAARADAERRAPRKAKRPDSFWDAEAATEMGRQLEELT
jgi:hypothetical protein